MLYARDMGNPFEAVEGLKVIPFEMQHGNIMSTGYRIGDLAYCADMSSIPEHSMASLDGVKTLVVDAAGFPFKNGKVHANHEYIKHLQNLIKPKETYLTVLSVLLDYVDLDSKTPVDTIPAYDGLTIKIQF
jgi:phosphoribosyl 1,2-cyclic phosphate phosphodiesterase